MRTRLRDPAILTTAPPFLARVNLPDNDVQKYLQRLNRIPKDQQARLSRRRHVRISQIPPSWQPLHRYTPLIVRVLTHLNDLLSAEAPTRQTDPLYPHFI